MIVLIILGLVRLLLRFLLYVSGSSIRIAAVCHCVWLWGNAEWDVMSSPRLLDIFSPEMKTDFRSG